MSIYDPLRKKLESVSEDSIWFTFSEIEQILGRSLPSSAYRFNAWWGNDSSLKVGHVQARAWMHAGFKTSNVSIRARVVEFRRFC